MGSSPKLAIWLATASLRLGLTIRLPRALCSSIRATRPPRQLQRHASCPNLDFGPLVIGDLFWPTIPITPRGQLGTIYHLVWFGFLQGTPSGRGVVPHPPPRILPETTKSRGDERIIPRLRRCLTCNLFFQKLTFDMSRSFRSSVGRACGCYLVCATSRSTVRTRTKASPHSDALHSETPRAGASLVHLWPSG